MLSNDVKALIIETVELYSTVPLTQSIIDDGVEKLTKAKELLIKLPDDNTEEKVLYKVVLVHPYTYMDKIPNTFPNAGKIGRAHV